MNNLETAREWLRGMDAHDVDHMFDLCTEDLYGLEVAEPHPNIGCDAVKASYVDLFQGFPDCHSEILNGFAEGNQAIVEIRWVGTNTGSFRGTPPTDKVCDVRIAYVFAFRDGKISRITEYYDGATVAAQMS